MYIKQFYLACLSHASYLIGDEKTKTAVVVDPQRDVDRYLREARRKGFQIRHVILTHFHADFVSGHLELRRAVKARIHLGAKARADYAFHPLAEGDSLLLGDLRLGVLETPGHTPEAISLLIYDLAKDRDKPRAVLTGDTLFIGDVGRPDLMVASQMSAATLAGMLYDSLHEKLLKLPDQTLVYPAHGAGSLCGKNLSSETVSTIGAQRLYNPALKPMSRKEFIRLVTADWPEAPAYFSHDAEMNRRRRPTLDRALAKGLRPLSLARTLGFRRAGAYCLDVRDPQEWASGHLRASVNIGLGGRFAQWAGTLLSRDRKIVIIARPGREAEAAMRLGRIGFDQVAGFLNGGMRALKGRPGLVARTERLSPRALAWALASAAPPRVLDVRNEAERRAKKIPGSLHIPLNRLPRRLGAVPRRGPLVVHCASGYRSAIAASLLERAGVARVSDLAGGIL